MTEVNRFGLGRHIPGAVRREVRQRSKFGCVICRRGFYQYEHIEPVFAEAQVHDPARICCLCGGCHDAVTRRQLSKDLVAAAYKRVQMASSDEVAPPLGPLDFHDGNAELLIGGLLYSPAVHTVLRYHGLDLMRVTPGDETGEPGRISAVFTDDRGDPVFCLEENEWVGSTQAFDIEVIGPRLVVRRDLGLVCLALRLDPPGRIVVEQLDMRFRDAHILANENTYAIARDAGGPMPHWVHAYAQIHRSSPLGAAIEFVEPAALEERDRQFRGTAQEMATKERDIVLSANAGILVKPLGVAIASLCGSFSLVELAIGQASLDGMRRVLASHPDQVGRFISTGSISEEETPGAKPQ